MVENIKEKVIAILDKHFGDDYLLFLFGSFAKNKVDLASDIDLAIYSKKNIPLSIFAGAREEIEDKTPTLRSIDLINLNDENLERKLLENILKEGVLWRKGRSSNELLRSLKRRLKNSKR